MISVIGTGRVGSAFAFLTTSSALDDLVLVNRTKNRAIGEFLDLVTTIPAKSKISINATDQISEIQGSEVVIITASSGTIKDERTDLLPFNSPIISQLAKDLQKYSPESKIVVVTNPVDILTYQLLQETGFNKNQIIGVGSSIDSSRFRVILAKSQKVNQSEIYGIVMGEHGPTMVPVFSLSKLSGKSLELSKEKKIEITSELRNYWRGLVTYKGASVFGVAKHVFDIVKSIILNQELSISSSVYLNGEYDFHDLCMGVPITINKNGVQKINEYSLDESEYELLKVSANKIRDGIKIILK